MGFERSRCESLQEKGADIVRAPRFKLAAYIVQLFDSHILMAIFQPRQILYCSPKNVPQCSTKW